MTGTTVKDQCHLARVATYFMSSSYEELNILIRIMTSKMVVRATRSYLCRHWSSNKYGGKHIILTGSVSTEKLKNATSTVGRVVGEGYILYTPIFCTPHVYKIPWRCLSRKRQTLNKNTSRLQRHTIRTVVTGPSGSKAAEARTRNSDHPHPSPYRGSSNATIFRRPRLEPFD